ncbi:hypothetical protein [Micromonospora zhanjiangensis]|uniref:Uncharacterized protein n=1 Tax=Micromonospora zhanjiangensis TaxID=1522057 RepID=A0ABV8KFI9_9ACTN
MIPKVGDVLVIDRAASVQFVEPLLFRVTVVHHDRHTYDGWLWLGGYQLAPDGTAVARRDIFVQPSGLRPARRRPAPESPTVTTRPRADRSGR